MGQLAGLANWFPTKLTNFAGLTRPFGVRTRGVEGMFDLTKYFCYKLFKVHYDKVYDLIQLYTPIHFHRIIFANIF